MTSNVDPASLPVASNGMPLPLLSKLVTADILGMSVRQLDRVIKRGDLPTVRYGARVFLHPSDVQAFIVRHRS